MKTVVLTGGRTNRMLPLTDGYPRALLSIMGKPLFMYPLASALRATGDKAILVTSGDVPMGEIVRSVNESGYAASISVRVQQLPGIEGALMAAAEALEGDDWFMLVYGDVIVEEDAFRRILEVHRGEERPSVLLVPRPDVQAFGAAFARENLVTRVVESVSGKETSYVVGGVFILPSEFFVLLERGLKFFEALNYLIEKVGVYAAYWTGEWVAVDYPWDLINAFYSLTKRRCGLSIAATARVSHTAILEGCVIVDEGATIDHYAVLKGPVYVGRGAFVGKGAFVREYTSIEEHAVVGAHTEVKRSVLQPHATVGSFSLITDSVLGYRSVAEPRTTVLSVLPDDYTLTRELPLQGLMGKKKKLGVFVAPYARIKAGSVVGPAARIYRDGRVEGI